MGGPRRSFASQRSPVRSRLAPLGKMKLGSHLRLPGFLLSWCQNPNSAGNSAKRRRKKGQIVAFSSAVSLSPSASRWCSRRYSTTSERWRTLTESVIQRVCGLLDELSTRWRRLADPGIGCFSSDTPAQHGAKQDSGGILRTQDTFTAYHP